MSQPPAEAGPPPLVRLDGVSKAYPGGAVALDGLSLAVGAGEFVVFVGPSGCGKSTALRLIAGLAEPTGGAVRWGDGGRPDLGFVFQDATLLPWARAWDNVYLPLRLRGVSRAEARDEVDAALELVGLAAESRRRPWQLSGGQRMRVAIARALVTRPRLLLMDEPFAALDEITRFRLNDDLLRLWRERDLTVLFVTHSVYESVYLGERVVVMASGPGRVVDEVAVAPPGERDAGYRGSPEFAATCARVSEALLRASAG